MKTVIVTGGTKGLGLGIVRRLVSDGYRVVAVARNDTQALHDAGGTFHACDLADIAALATLARDIRTAHGPVWGLVNNAGIGTSGVLAAMPDIEIERLLRLNVQSPITLTRHVVRGMMAKAGEARGGRIVNMSSIVATTGYSGLSAYAATKSALLGFTHSLARELGPLGITVNAVAPGFVATELTHDLTEKQRDQIARRSPLGRLAGVDDVAAAVAFLIGDDARHITGTTMTVDAGNTA